MTIWWTVTQAITAFLVGVYFMFLKSLTIYIQIKWVNVFNLPYLVAGFSLREGFKCCCQHVWCLVHIWKARFPSCSDTALPINTLASVGYVQPPNAHVVRCIPWAISCSVLYHGPELYSDRNIQLEKLCFGVLLFHTSFLFYCSVPFCCPVLPRALTWGIPSNYLLVTLLHSKLPFLFSSLLAFYVFLSPSITFKHSTYVNFLC